MAILSVIKHRFWNNDGTVASGGKVYTYEAGTSTPKTSYTDSTGTVANTNPAILNAKGECDLWMSGLYKVNVLQSDDVQITGYPVDNIGYDVEYLSAANYGADPGESASNNVTYLLAACAAAKTAKKRLFIPAGTYNVNGTCIANLTDDTLASNPANGLYVFGEPGTILKAAAGFPAATAIINLDGNTSDQTTTANARIQQHNYLEQIEVDCNSLADRGLRLRANRYFHYKNLYIHDAAGGVGDGSVQIIGVTGAGEDDTDTTSEGIFEGLRILNSTGWGVLGTNNRCGNIKFQNADIRGCSYDEMRIAFAGLTLDTCTFASNGSVASATSGGFSAVKSTTGAQTRGLVMNGCDFEANFNHEFNIDHCAGFVINGGHCAPYVSAAASQDVGRFGVGSDTVSGGVIQGFRVQNYTTGAHTIYGMQVGANASNIAFVMDSFYGGAPWTAATTYVINASATGITKDGYAISSGHIKPSFMFWGVTNAGATATLINNVDFYTGGAAAGLAYFSTGSVTEDHNNGGCVTNNADAASGIFTAPYTGFYEIGVKFSVRGFDATQTQMELALIKNLLGTPVRYTILETQLDGYTAADTEQFTGSLQMKLLQGDTVVGAIKVTGGAANALIDRVKQGSFTFWGRAF